MKPSREISILECIRLVRNSWVVLLWDWWVIWTTYHVMGQHSWIGEMLKTKAKAKGEERPEAHNIAQATYRSGRESWLKRKWDAMPWAREKELRNLGIIYYVSNRSLINQRRNALVVVTVFITVIFFPFVISQLGFVTHLRRSKGKYCSCWRFPWTNHQVSKWVGEEETSDRNACCKEEQILAFTL